MTLPPLLLRVLPKSQRGRFGLRVALTLIPMLLVWWLAAAFVIDGLRPVGRILIQLLQLGVGVSANAATHDWIVDTGLTRATGTVVGGVGVAVPMEELRRITMSFPLFLALVLTPPTHKRIRAAVIGCLILALVFCMSACGLTFNAIASIINHRSSVVADNIPPPDFTVTHPPLSDFVFFLAGLSTYLGLQVMPMAAPVMVWAGLNWPGVKTLLHAGAEQDPQGPETSEAAEIPSETAPADPA